MMPHSSTLPFSVAKFSIEGAGEGADHLKSAPPCLSSSQTASVVKIEPLFSINPFSLSRSSSLKLHTGFLPSQGSVNTSSASAAVISPSASSSISPWQTSANISYNFLPPAPVPLLLHLYILFSQILFTSDGTPILNQNPLSLKNLPHQQNLTSLDILI